MPTRHNALRRLILLLFAAGACAGNKLPTKIYTTKDGLPRNNVVRVIADPRGLLWFCTPEGLSRFDGSYFTNYGTADGLPSADVTDLLVTRGGSYWVATSAGLARFEPRQQAPARFLVYRRGGLELGPIHALLQDSAGAMWIAAARGLYRSGNPDAAATADLQKIDLFDDTVPLRLAEGPDHSLWLGTAGGIVRRTPAGMIERHGVAEGLPDRPITALAIDAHGQVWGATEQGICILSKSAEGYRLRRVLKRRDGLAGTRVLALHRSRDGHIWAAGFNGLSEIVPSPDSAAIEIRSFEDRNNLRSQVLNSVTEDSQHNLWLGTHHSGAIQVLEGGFRSYAESDGLSGQPVLAFFEDLRGRLHAVSGRHQVISRLDGDAFVSAQPRYGADIVNLGYRRGQIALQDREGDWWLATYSGLYRFSGARRLEDLPHRQPAAVYTEHDGLAGHRIFRVFQDRRGDIWIATAPSGLSRWDRRSRSFRHFREVPQLQGVFVDGFAEDARGDLWISLQNRLGVFRNGKFEFFGPEAGLPASELLCLLIDHAGRLWFGTDRDGLGRVDQPGATTWKIRMYTAGDHLSSNSIECLVEDALGRIYAGTGRGMDRLDPATGLVRAYGPADGLAGGLVRAAYRDRQGHLWFGTTTGASEFVPAAEDAAPPLRVLISGIRVRGRPRSVSELGETVIPPFELGVGDNQLEIGLASIGASSDGPLKYRYRLQGSSGEWSSPTGDRIVNLVGLGPGSYRFEVKAVASDGRESEALATAQFVVLAPLWKRWWFLATMVALLAAIASWLHRRRLHKVLELERVRTRIATDLHDDVGASLSRIAILTEVVHRRNHEGKDGVPQLLSEIASTARELVDSMSDIVWAIDPEHDRIDDLSRRMRRFAEDLCGASDIPLIFRAPDSAGLAADPHLRREVYLVLKESLNNVVRHSGCTEARVEFRAGPDGLSLTVADNGRGFDAGANPGGHGMRSIRERARRIGGSAAWKSGPGGTSMELHAPLSPWPHEHAVYRGGELP